MMCDFSAKMSFSRKEQRDILHECGGKNKQTRASHNVFIFIFEGDWENLSLVNSEGRNDQRQSKQICILTDQQSSKEETWIASHFQAEETLMFAFVVPHHGTDLGRSLESPAGVSFSTRPFAFHYPSFGKCLQPKKVFRYSYEVVYLESLSLFVSSLLSLVALLRNTWAYFSEVL